MTYVRMADAAFAANIPPGFDIAAGYYGGPNAYHVWARADWDRFPGYRLPIWVAGQNSLTEAPQALAELMRLGVPKGCRTAIDMETRNSRADIAYVEDFGGQLQAAGYLVEVYGSRGSVFRLPPLNGYWVAAYGLSTQEVDAILQSGDHVRAVQFAANLAPGYDMSLVKAWTEGEMWHG